MQRNSLVHIKGALRKNAEASYDRALSMPGIFYTSPEFLELERAHLFSREWICLGRTEELEKPGDYLTATILEEPILLIRGDDGLIRAFSNVCRHRGMLIAEGAGSCRRLVCPYHHWTYDRMGQLVAAPNFDGRPGFDAKTYRLPEIRCEIWQGFVFVSLADDPQPLAAQLAPLEERIRHYGFGEMKLRYISNEVWDTNWKCLMENFMEGYHLSSLHRKTLHRLNPTTLCRHFEPGDGYFGFYSGFSENLERMESKNPELGQDDLEQCVMFAVPPGLAVGAASDYSSFISIQPQSTGQVRVKLGLFFSNDEWHEEKINEAIDLFQRTASEDKVALKGVQVGLASKYHAQGPLAPQDYEGCILDFYNYLARRLDSVL